MFKKYFYTPSYLLFVDAEGADDAAGGDKKDEKTEVKSVKSAMELATEEVDKKFTKDGVKDETKEDKKEDKKDDESEDSDEEDDEEEDLSEEETSHAKELFKLLKNPQTAKATLLHMVTTAGLDLKAETKEEKKEIKKSVKEMVKEKLGEKYPFLADQLGDTLTDLFKEFGEESTKDIREKIAAGEQKEALQQIKTAQDNVLNTYVEVPSNVLKEILRIQEVGEIIPGSKVDPEKYFKACLMLAVENLNVTLVKKAHGKDLIKKAPTPLEKLNAASRGSAKEGTKTVQVKSLKDAITAGVETVDATYQK